MTTVTSQSDSTALATKTTTPTPPLTIDRHPDYDLLVTWVNFGMVDINGETIEQGKDLVEVMNALHPEHTISPAALTRLKKRIIRERGGYMLRDGRLARKDGSVIQVIGLPEALEAIVHAGIENLLMSPYRIRADEVIKAATLLRELRKETEESDGFSDAWTEHYKSRRKKKVINVTPTLPVEGALEDDACDDSES